MELSCPSGHNNSDLSKFCSVCGQTMVPAARNVASKDKEVNRSIGFKDKNYKGSTKESKTSSTPLAPTTLKKSSKKNKVIISSIIASLASISILSAVLINTGETISINPSSPNWQDSAESQQLTYKDMSDNDFDWVNLESGLCSQIVNALNDETKNYFNYLEEINSVSSEQYAASTFINANSWTSTSNFRVNLGKQIEDNLLKEEYRRYAIKDTELAYYDQFTESTMATCGLTQRWQTSREDANSIDSKLSALRESAESQPWYAKGYSEYSSTIYYKFSEPDNFECDYNDSTCGQITFQTRDGCTEFKASFNFIDSTDNTVYDTVIEIVNNVDPSEKIKIKFHSFDSGSIDIADKVQLENASCN
jgi:hypothetical protein